MAIPSPLQPNLNSTATLNATSTSSRVAVTMGGSATQVEVTNKSAANWVYVEAGDSTVVAVLPANGASVGAYPVGPGQSKIITLPTTITNIAAICDSALTATVFFTPGQGAS
jgi:hypothetical protein